MLKKIFDRLKAVVEIEPTTQRKETLTITGLSKTKNTWSADNLQVSNLSFSDLYDTCQK